MKRFRLKISEMFWAIAFIAVVLYLAIAFVQHIGQWEKESDALIEDSFDRFADQAEKAAIAHPEDAQKYKNRAVRLRNYASKYKN